MSVAGFDERTRSEKAAMAYISQQFGTMGVAERFLQSKHHTSESDVQEWQEQLLLPFAVPWKVQNASRYEVKQHKELRIVKQAKLSEYSLDDGVVQDANQQAVFTVLHDTYDVPWLLLVSMTAQQRAWLYNGLKTKYKSIMVIHVAHGLGNRLRALTGAKSFADGTWRMPIVVWERDAHCGALFEELFKVDDELVVLNGMDVRWPFEEERRSDGAWMQWWLYNYMSAEGGVKDEPLKDGAQHHVYYRGAYVPKVKHEDLLKNMNAVLRRLRPVSQVMDRVEEISERLKTSIGVHIRHSDPRNELEGLSGRQLYGESETEVIRYWRSVSEAKSFGKEIQRIWEGAGTSGSEVFVATDCRKCREELGDILGESVWWMEGDAGGCEGGGERSAECVAWATAELWALSRCERVLGSMWSSFSEVAGRLAGGVRYAGADFGRVGTEEWAPAVRAVADRVWTKHDDKRRREDGV
ncbi:unnamed protein product [Agarophyton chilense]